ncbi:MAG: peptidylprolyl isomerase [Prevotella sp.]|nr:peptidylprolyl isomerase [Prevotella sp.]
MRRIILLITLTWTLAATAQEQTRRQVLIETTMGDIRIELYDETPLHRDNFIRLAEAGFYDGLLFHRVIYGFMIQAGDPSTRHEGEKGPEVELNKIPAEIRYPQLFHKRGVLAAAREGDSVNPERKSSASQFYIVYGKRYDDAMLDRMKESLDRNTNGEVKLTPEVREAYKTYGGTPHLDGQYTVFGEVIEGLDIVKAIDWVDTDPSDRPLTDVRIIQARVVK